MSGTSSKHGQRQAARDNWGAPLSRTISLPVDCLVEGREEGKNMVASIPSFRGIFRVEHSADLHGDFIGTNVVNNDLADEADDFYSWYISDSTGVRKLRHEEAKIDNGRERLNLGAPMEAIDEHPSPFPPPRVPTFPKPRILDRSVSSPIVLEMDSYFWKANRLKTSLWRKYFLGDQSRSEMLKSFKESLAPAMARFNLFSPRRSWCRRVFERRRFSPRDSADGGTGLSLLLHPTIQLSPAHSSTSCSSPIKKSVNTDCLFTSSISQPKSPLKSSKELSLAGWPASSDGSLESNGPLFDPVLIATFEKALESVCESDWDSTNGSTTSFSCSENSCNSSETSSDADSQYMAIPQFEEINVRLERGHNEPGFQEEAGDNCDRKLPFSIVPAFNKEGDWKYLEFLENYDLRCPPGGEGKIVLYFTSLRVVRRTFEDCNRLRLTFRGLRMHVDERDVWMHSRFKQELTDLLLKGVTVPRLFIKGRYIGGAQEVEQLHEDGILVKLLKGVPTEDVLKPCDGCGDVRFIPCLTCSGSCKVIVEDSEVTQCPCCNENGLIMCPLCSS